MTNKGDMQNCQADREKKKVEKGIEELETVLEELGKRQSDLQSNAFQLANYYFVFQGVILSAIWNWNASQRTKCSSRWFILSLSSIAAVINLVALCLIGSKYNQTITLHRRNTSKFNELKKNLSKLELELASNAKSIPAADGDHIDDYEETMRRTVLYFCMSLFVAFAVIVLVACFKVPCMSHTTGQYSTNSDKCMTVNCDGGKCLHICYDL
ncbi:ATP-dependent RNA helicase ddx56 [Quillaja saponaria]|uniref:ATP-dependent RNA helicase ddx56 n=1 Tax=Quillaja saponaria TaxID=32244 RepID=A0AAD7LXG8_QUISA|nr:ATP-dependent RNA helicase ddx56 [Quillaja saponaria]